jgi:N-methylhydantoinase A
MWRVGIDVGGTFTDLYAWDDETRAQVTSKVLTTRPDRAPGVINAIREAGIPFDRISHLMHGTTTATHAHTHTHATLREPDPDAPEVLESVSAS